MRRMIRALARLDDHWIGDMLGSACLFVGLWMGLLACLVFGGAQ